MIEADGIFCEAVNIGGSVTPIAITAEMIKAQRIDKIKEHIHTAMK